MNPQIVFYILAAVIIVFSLLAVTGKKILRAAIYLLFVLIAIAGVYFLLGYTFLGAVQLTVYGGGIMVLIIFSILLTHDIDHEMRTPGMVRGIFSGLVALAGIVMTLLVGFGFDFKRHDLPATSPDVKTIGHQLLGVGDNGYILPFEVISILLLAGIIGAVIIAKRRNGNDIPQQETKG